MRKLGISLMAASLAWLSAPVPSHAAQVFTTDLIVQGSECVGFDCNSSESFGFDTIRLKENNLRIHFNDTSNSGSFPSNDWRIVINDSANGGANYFAIEDSTAGNQPFRVDAGAGANALRIESGGNVGLGNSNPAVELHVTDGDTPTLRLEQDGSSGFTPQTFDVASNEANFFIRDVTNGSRLPFRIRPGAGTSSIDIKSDGSVVMFPGSSNQTAEASLHVKRTNDTAQLLVEDTGSAAQDLLVLRNAGPSRFVLTNTASTGNSTEWRFNHANNGALRIAADDGDVELDLDQNGNMTITGNFFAQGGTQLNVPDYVFAPDYNLMPLTELATFIKEEKHLPNIPSAKEIGNAGAINMTEMQLKLLEKVEELTLYTLAQEKTINELQERLAALE